MEVTITLTSAERVYIYVQRNLTIRTGRSLPKIADAYPKYFGRNYPAATALQVGRLASSGILLEIEAIAVIR